ncbi:MAG: GNAT family N-acetyltransferase [Gemmatimonadota bacterium]
MHEELTQTTLKTGEPLRIMVVEAPDDEHAGTVLNLLSHKGELRQWQFQEDFAGRAPGLRSRYYLGFLEGRAVANISVWESGVAGNLGHVHTLPPHRRKGICTAVMAVQMEDFRRRGGEALVLGTGFDGAPYHIYRSFGFESLTPGSGAMIYRRRATFFEEYFAPGPVTCGPAEWRDLGAVCALMALPAGDWLRSRGARKFGPGNYESAFIEDVRETQRGARQVRVGRTASGAVVAYAVLGPDRVWGEATWGLDLFAHPAFADRVGALVEGFSWPAAAVHCYLDAPSPARAGLEAAGFGERARLPGLLRRAGAGVDVAILGRG